ncbi:MAG TPA: ABC transporter ATP-binding protein [Candidatus Saccharimonadales bacterium]|nr:ABC transporter ATP-binding protein [Candidatus Saccharimonadales bacterium]
MTPLLQLSNLLVRREGSIVLDVNSLSVASGEVLAIVGPNGAGKSTLFLVLARLLKADRGQVIFNGRHTDSFGDLEYRRQLALVLQEPLLMDMSVYENAAIGLKFRRRPKAQIEEQVNHWLHRLGVAHLSNRPARKLSGGEAQRVSLARAFVLQPELLLLDEPFTSLDAPTRIRLLEDLKSVLAETKMTTIFITHDLQEALKLATHMAVILDGRIEQCGTSQNVFDRPINDRVADFLGR